MKRVAKLKFWSFILTLLITLAIAPVAGAQSTGDPAAVLTAFEKVAFGNTQDIEAALALFSDNAVLTVTPPPAGTTGVWTGKDEIRKGLQFNKQLNVSRVNTGTPKVEGNKVTISAQVSNNFFQMIGVAPVAHTTEVVVEGGKIQSYTSTMLASEQQRVAAATKAYQAANPVQQPVGLPNSGLGQESTQSPLALTIILPGLLVIGLLSLGAIFFVRRTRQQTK